MLATLIAGYGLSALAPAVGRRAGASRCAWLAVFPAALFAAAASRLPPFDEPPAPLSWALGLELSWRFDGLGLLLALLVTGVGAAVTAYAAGYFSDGRETGRFLAWLLAFMTSMLGLVLTDDLLALFMFWELTSLCSYFLIGFRAESPEARAAALQALLVTAAGGLALLAGFLLIGEAAGTYRISALSGSGVRDDASYPAILALILLGAATKSAQFPFSFWLPNAMAAPTPASAYLHAATMVKAGVYLLARMSPALGGTASWQGALMVMGGATMALGAWRALRETDLKRVLAHSTLSMLGTLTLLLGPGTEACAKAWVLVLTAHALYKGALFLAAGAVEHGAGTRDARRLSGLGAAMPRTAAAAMAGALSMAALPPSLGFVAKESLLAAVLEAPAGAAVAAACAAAGACLLAAAVVVGARPFLGPPGEGGHDPSPLLWAPAAGLAAAGLVAAAAPGFAALGREAAASIQGAAVGPLPLGLWHGLTPELLIGAAAAAAGAALFAARERLRASPRGFPAAEAAYESVLAAVRGAGRAQTRLLQSGDLRLYIATVLACCGVAVGVPLAGGAIRPPSSSTPPFAWEAALALVIAASALAVVFIRERLHAIIAMGAVGYGVALLFLLFGAPDLAMTQFVVESLTVILFVLTLPRVPAIERSPSAASRLARLAVCLPVGSVMAALTWSASGGDARRPLADFFLERSLPQGHGRNVVNVILVDFRALDTLGEIAVLGTAALGVFTLLAAARRSGAAR